MQDSLLENSTIAIKKHKRVLLKISGEGFCSEKSPVIDNSKVQPYSKRNQNARKAGVEIAMVVGGGNTYNKRSGIK